MALKTIEKTCKTHQTIITNKEICDKGFLSFHFKLWKYSKHKHLQKIKLVMNNK